VVVEVTGGWVTVVVVVDVTVDVTGGKLVVVLVLLEVVPAFHKAVPWERPDVLPPTTISSLARPEFCKLPWTPQAFP